MLNKQFKLYSVDTKSFYNKKEKEKDEVIKEVNIKLYLIKQFTLINEGNYNYEDEEHKYLNEYKNQYSTLEDFKEAKKSKVIKRDINKIVKEHKNIIKTKEFKESLNKNEYYKDWNDKVRKTKNNPGQKSKLEELKSELSELIKNNIEKVDRELDPEKISKFNLVATFDGALSRILQLEQDGITEDLIIIRIFHYDILDNLLHKGFNYKGEHYVFYTAGAGQIRKKKVIFIKENVWDKYKNTITCGLSEEIINNLGGVSINKFLSYLALNNSATDLWEDFNIDKTIVVSDFETTLKEVNVDYISKVKRSRKIKDKNDNELTEEYWELQEVQNNSKKDITITHSDGCGMILSNKKKDKAFQFRMPWFKGLLVPVNYIDWIDRYNYSKATIKDIWGKEWDLKKDSIQIIFSESQFKMHKYYSSWNNYKDNFKKYSCQAGKCNIEEDVFKRVKYNYQMWQTLNTDIKRIKPFTNIIDVLITNAYTNLNTMLYVLGATKKNKHKTYKQQALEIYPELLKDKYFKEQLSSAISSIKKNAKCGKFKVDGYNTFLIPDIVAWMQYLFVEEDNPEGSLKDGEVSCKLFENNKDILVNRSPHLYKEHAVRKNIINKKYEGYFITNGIYTSCHDMVSKILQFDNDGDHATVIQDRNIVELARESMEGISSLYYEMDKADPVEINPDNIYIALKIAFKSSNIGKYSNMLTKIWNKDDISMDDLNTAKIIAALNNYAIDSAKTLEMPTFTDNIKKQLRETKKLELPYFFKYVKDNAEVRDINNSTVNTICKQIENIGQGDFKFKLTGYRSSKLMHNKDIMEKIKSELADEVIEEYKKVDKEKNKYFFKVDELDEDDRREVVVATWSDIKDEFNKFCEEKEIDLIDAVDLIIKYIYSTRRDSKKTLLFNVFGDIIVNNLRTNIKNPLGDKIGEYFICEFCGKRIKRESNRQKMCKDCSKEKIRENDRLRKKKK